MPDLKKVFGMADLPGKNDPKVVKRRTDAKKALKKLVAAGAAGAFFSAIIRSFPVDAQQIAWHGERIDWTATWDHIDRYGYLFWLLFYFFFSTFNSEQAEDQTGRPDVIFHVVQSVVSLGAAYYLGFIVAGTAYGLRAYFAVNLAILVICGLSLYLFHKEKPYSFNTYRKTGVVLSGLACALAVDLHLRRVGLTVGSLLLFLLLQILLWGVVWGFGRIMLHTPQVRAEATKVNGVEPEAPVAPVSVAASATPDVPVSAAGAEKPVPIAPEIKAPEGGGGA